MQFREWLCNEAKIMILPWPKIKKMGMDHLASDEAKKGAYLDASKFDFSNPNFEDALLNGKFYKKGEILAGYYDNKNLKYPPQFHVNDEIKGLDSVLDLKKPNTNKIKINMITNHGTNRKWKWFTQDKIDKNKDYYQITSVEVYSKGSTEHFYCLNLFIWTPFVLQNYPGGEPRSRPTTYGTVSFGKPVGSVIVSGKKPKTLYDTIAIV